jgi:hypothetical protein
MIVKAAPGLKVPREDKPREYITEADPVDVPGSAYYLRRLADGDLVSGEKAATSAQAAQKSKE